MKAWIKIITFLRILPLLTTITASFLIWLSPTYGLPDQNSKDKELAALLFVDPKSDPDKRKSEEKIIAAYAFQKARELAANNKQFEEDVDLDSLDSEGGIDYHDINKDNILIVLQTSRAAYQCGGCLFLVNKEKGEWKPIPLHYLDGSNAKETYGIVTDNIDYTAPILTEWARGAGWYAAIGTQYAYLFQNGAFKLIRTVDNNITQEGSDILHKNPDMAPDEVMVETVYPQNSAITKLYNQFSPKGASSLDNLENWKRIFFVQTEKAYFHEQPNDDTQKKSYLVSGDAVYVDKVQDKWAFAKYINATTDATAEGWINLENLMNLDVSNDELATLKL
jgi:hypothetical protein